MKKILIYRLCASIIFLCLVLTAQAQSIISREYFEPNTDFDDVALDIQDDRYADLVANTGIDFRDKTAYGLVTVGFDADMNICYGNAKRYKIRLKSVEMIIENPGDTTTQVNYYDLTINYDPNLQHIETENAFIKIDFARALEISIVEVKEVDDDGNETSVATPDLMPEDIYVEAEIIRERYDNFVPNSGAGAIPVVTSLSSTLIDYYRDEHQVHIIEWANVEGAVEYDIEWLYVNNFGSGNLASTIPDNQIVVAFQNNSTRVRVPRKTTNQYFIPAIYNRGYVVYRIRAVGRGGPDLEDDVIGIWTLGDISYDMATIITAHTASYRVSVLERGPYSPYHFNNVNSQYSVQFAEDGKLMASGTFADGSMRVRQNVAAVKIHADSAYGKMAVITETIYDHLGRAAITTLPGVTKNGLWYSPNYSQNTNGDKYSYLDFDTDGFADENTCVTGAGPMWNQSGASQYYSPNNAYKTGYQGLIADAYQYPFIQNIFERDNTNRPKMQSGVGKDHNIGSGHETKYIYGGAEQTQLNRLFGTDAGYASYYQKNMIIDANQQISITYTDMAGRTVATSLAGEVPDNVAALTDSVGNIQAESGDTIQEDMLVLSDDFPNGSSNMLSSDSTSFTFSSTVLIDSEQEYTFSYSAEIADFMDSCFVNICFDCIYDLELSLTDECGNYIIGNEALTGPLKMTIGGHSTDTICADTNFVALNDMVLMLKPGAYNIFKRLSINEDSMDVYVEKMLQSSICLKTFDDFYQAPDLSGCDISCEDCLANIGTWEEFYTQEKIDSSFGGDSLLAQQVLRQVYTSMKQDCEGLCTDNSRDYCDAAYNLMLMDMSPGGQYAADTADTAIAIMVSIFNPNNILPLKYSHQFNVALPAGISGQVPSWRHPVLFKPNTPTPYVEGYFNDLGERVKIHVEIDENDEFYPKVLDTSLVEIIDVSTNSFYTYPENLLNLSDFLNYWSPSYAKSLVFYHPEFFQYEYCSSLYPYTQTLMGRTVDGYDFDGVLSDMNFAQADSVFGLSSGSSITDVFDAITGLDPYFAQHPLSGCSGSGFGYPVTMPNLTPCNLFKIKFLEFQQLDLMRNIAQMAYIQNNCGYTYPAGCGTLPTQIWGSGGLINNTQTWETFADYYSSAKQQAALLAMNLYATYGDTAHIAATWTGVNTECIGSSSFFPVYEWNSGTPVLTNPCTFPYFVYYQHCERRFQSTSSQISQELGMSDPPTLDELEQYALQGYYQQTGKCPMASDLEYLMAKLAMEDVLQTSLVNLNLGAYMGNSLFSFIKDTLNNDTATVFYQGTFAGTTLTANMGLPCTAFSLTLPASAVTAGYTFADVQTVFGMRNIAYAGSDYTFMVSAIFLNPSIYSVPETLDVVGRSCLPLMGCEAQFRNPCKSTPEAKDLMNLMSALSMGGDLFGTSVNLSPSYEAFITPRLQIYLGNAPFTWNYDSGSNEFELSGAVSSLVLDVSSSGFSPSNIYQFTSVAGNAGSTVSTGIYSDFTYTAIEIDTANYYPYPSLDTAAVYVTMQGIINTVGIAQSFPVTECNPVIPIQCNTQAHKNLEILREKANLSFFYGDVELASDLIDSSNCFPLLWISDSSAFDVGIASINYVEADMSLSENGVESNYYTFSVLTNAAQIVVGKGHSCLPLRNCETCENECPHPGITVKIGPLSQYDPEAYGKLRLDFDSSYGSYLDCWHVSPTNFTFEHTSAMAFWQDWAQSINEESDGNITALLEGGYLLLTIDTVGIPKCECNEDDYILTDSNGEFIASFTTQCCGVESLTASCPQTIINAPYFLDGWLESSGFEEHHWDNLTDGSLIYEQDSMLIMENDCIAILMANTSIWDTASLYKITSEFVAFNTPDPIGNIQLSFFDSTGLWIESIFPTAGSLQSFYFMPHQTYMRFGLQTQNAYWGEDTSYCTGSSKVGVKYLKVEKLNPYYSPVNEIVNNEGLTSQNIYANSSDVLLTPLDNPDAGMGAQIWKEDSTLYVSAPCGAAALHYIRTCEGVHTYMEAEILPVDSTHAPTGIYALLLANDGVMAAFGPFVPGAINYDFVSTSSEVVVLYLAVHSDSALPDAETFIGSGGNLLGYCTDSVKYKLTKSITTLGCHVGYVCGTEPPPPCKTVLFSKTDFEEGWFDTQDAFGFNAFGPEGSPSVYEDDGSLVLHLDCAGKLSRQFNQIHSGDMVHISIDVSYDAANLPTQAVWALGTPSNPQAIERITLVEGINEIYIQSPIDSAVLSIIAMNGLPEEPVTCLGTANIIINGMLVEVIHDDLPQQNYYVNQALDSSDFSSPGYGPVYTGFFPTAMVEGHDAPELSIADGLLQVSADCFAGGIFRPYKNLCTGYTYSGELGIVATDSATAPTAIFIAVFAEGEDYGELKGPYAPGIINYSYTPTVENVLFGIIAMNIDTVLDQLPFGTDIDLSSHCLGAVNYSITHHIITSGCTKSYACAIQDSVPWEPVIPLTFNTDDCHPTILPFPPDTSEQGNPCVEYMMETAQANAQYQYNQYLDQMREQYKRLYIRKCMVPVRENLERQYTDGQYHYTLYYYDRAGNLVKTVPPHAVNPLSGSALAAVNNARDNHSVQVPKHNQTGQASFALSTRYRYNSLNQPVEQETPDGGKSNFYYDRLGRVAVSQNAVQSQHGYYSYTLYDGLGRITEVGQLLQMFVTASRPAIYEPASESYFFGSANAHDQITRTFYDSAATGTTFAGGFAQHNLRSRVSYTQAMPMGDDDFRFATYYDYDIHGNVRALIQENLLAPAPDLEQNLVEYEYDLVSGVVKKVAYNRHRPDRYYHRYDYDDQNRLTYAHTSRNGIRYDQDARYFYYRHGPLARVETGHNKVQGTDYAYSIHGWLKSVNSDALADAIDPGRDGNVAPGNDNRYFGRDAYGYSLHYYAGDYYPIESANVQTKTLPTTYTPVSLFNGNISAMNNTLKKPDDYSVLPLLQRFGYDQLNRIAASRAFGTYDFGGNTWDSTQAAMDIYATSYGYDPAGNLKTLTRNGNKLDTLEMDSLKYVYHPNTNRLMRVNDVVSVANYGVDVDNQSGTNYTYDAIGNLISDAAEEIDTIKWTVYGKVAAVIRSSGSMKPDLQFYYDAAGRRIMKKVIPKTGTPDKTEYYVHDAQGNPLTIYAYIGGDTATYKVNEQMIYGSSRIGTWKSGLDLLSHIPEEPEVMATDRGNKRYEFNDHLGNVHAVLTDRKKRICDDDTLTYYEADIQNTYDYYAFGMMMPGRDFSAAPLCDSAAIALTDTLYYNATGDTTGWTPYGGSTVSADAGKLLIATATPPNAWGATLQLALEAGRTYSISVDYTLSEVPECDRTPKATISLAEGSDEPYAEDFDLGSGNLGGSFTPLYTGLYTLSFSLPDSTCKDSLWIDNLLVTTLDTLFATDCASKDNYRFSFNGKESTDEWSGDGNMYDYGFRIYDPRIGRFLSVDPLFKSFPWFTPYQFAGNTPILCIDIDGLENAVATVKYTVEIWENGVKLPDGTQRVVGFTTYTANTTITQQGEEGGEIINHLTTVGGTQNGIHVSERVIIEKPTPAITQADQQDVVQVSQTTQSTANNNPPPSPAVDPESGAGGKKLFGKEVPEPGGKPIWVKGNSKFAGYGWDIQNAGEMKSSLDPIANLLNSDPDLQITIYGNTAIPGMDWDDAMPAQPNLKMKDLALNRANAVKEFLMKEYGVDAKQIKTTKAAKTGGGHSANYSITNQAKE